MGVEIAVGIAIGAVVGGTAAAIQSDGNFDAIWKGALVGAAGGAVGGWAAPALTGALGSVAGGMAAGGLGGVTSGLLGAAVNGGTGDDYWKGALFGGLGGAAVGGLTAGLGEAFGGQAAPVDASGVSADGMVTGTPYTSDVTGATTPLSDAGASTLSTAPTATGVGGGNIDAASAINASVTGGTAAPAPAGLESMGSTGGLESLGFTGNTAAQQSMQNLGLASLGEGSSTPFTPNMSTPTNVGIGGGDYGVTTSTGSVLDSSGNTLGNAPGFETAGTPTVRGTADLGGDSGWSMDKLFNWNNGKDMLGKLAAGQMMGNALKGVGSVAGMEEARQNKGQLMDLYNTMQNQYNTQNAAANQYQNQLSETYSDPNAYLNSPEALASRQLAMQKLLAQNAMAGRRTAGLSMQNQLMMNQLSNLANYRQGLRSAATGAYASPTGLGTTLQAAQAQSPQGNLFAGLGSMFAPAATYYLM